MWQWLRKLVVVSIIRDLGGNSDYLKRWNLKLRNGFSIKLHKIMRADDDRCSHDHPWAFLRIILWGGYVEEQGPDHKRVDVLPWRPWAPWRIYWCPSNFRHRIDHLHGKTSWSLVICWPVTQKWGFFTRDGWVYYKTFVDAAISRRVLWCDDGKELRNDHMRRAPGEYDDPVEKAKA